MEYRTIDYASPAVMTLAQADIALKGANGGVTPKSGQSSPLTSLVAFPELSTTSGLARSRQKRGAITCPTGARNISLGGSR